MAEREGFEPSVLETSTPDFESGAFDHSATFPGYCCAWSRVSEAAHSSSPFHQKHYEMKLMDFFVKLGADPQSHWQCAKGMQRRMTEKDAISCSGFGETDYQCLRRLKP